MIRAEFRKWSEKDRVLQGNACSLIQHVYMLLDALYVLYMRMDEISFVDFYDRKHIINRDGSFSFNF